MSLSAADIRRLYTTMLVDVYRESPQPTSFLQSFFKSDVVPTKSFSIQVERMGERVAIDVVRGTEGNRNTFTRSTEKMFEPPLFREYLDYTELDLYDIVLGATNGRNDLFKALVNEGAKRLNDITNKIKRAKELQCAQVFETGIVTMRYGVSATINYNRRPTSIVDVPADYFATNSDPFAVFEKGCDYLRKTGKAMGGTFNAILGNDALRDLLANTKFIARQSMFNMNLDAVIAPSGVRDAVGNTFHGIITCGTYKVQLWCYPQFYDLNTGTDAAPVYVQTPYWNPKKVVMMPPNPRFIMTHCAVPRLIGTPGQLPAQGEYVFQEFLDERLAKHILDVQSAPVATPVAVDHLYTFTAVA